MYPKIVNPMKYFFTKKQKRHDLNGGQAILMVVIMCTSIFLTIVLGVVDPIVNELRLSRDLLGSKASLYVAESSTEDGVFRIKHNMIDNYATPISITINSYTATTTISNTSAGKALDTTGSDNSNFRNVHTEITSGVGVDFFYGVQSGNGGFSLTGGGKVVGNVYTNGSFLAGNGVTVTGSVVAANSTSMVGGGGYVGSLNVGSGGVGDVWAHNVVGVSAQGTIYCQTGNTNNKSCNTSRTDPPNQDMPISDANIATWKADATAGTTYVGNYHVGYAGATLGPMKITGNLVVDGGGLLTLSGTIWVQGTITISNGADLKLAPGYGAGGGVLISDGIISLTGGANFSGSGQKGSFPVVITTSNSTNAMNVSGGTGAVVLVAQNGTLTLDGGAAARSMTAKRIVINGGGTVTYDAGLADFNFSSGPSGGWNISSWKEVQ